MKRLLHIVCVTLVAAPAAAAEITRDEALALAFPGATIRAERVFLTADQLKRASEQAREEIETPLVARYIATAAGQVVGRAYVDTHVVRTKKETLLISLDAKRAVRRIDVTAFLEPGEYRAPDLWLRQYSDRELADELQLNRAIRPIAGATLTARAVNNAVRRVLAIDGVLSAGNEP